MPAFVAEVPQHRAIGLAETLPDLDPADRLALRRGAVVREEVVDVPDALARKKTIPGDSPEPAA